MTVLGLIKMNKSQNKQQLDRFLTPLLRELVKDLIEVQPEDSLQYMIKWLENKCGIENARTEKEELFELREQLARLKSSSLDTNN